MKNNSILIVGLGVPSESTDVLMREGCDILRSETPLQAALVLLRGDAQAVLIVGDLGEEWNEFTDVALTTGKLVAVDSMITSSAPVMAKSGHGNGNGNGNGNGHGNGNGNGHSDEYARSGLSVHEVMALIQRRVDDLSLIHI